MSSAAKKHLDAINSGKVEKTNVIGIRKALAHVDRIRAGYSGNRSNATPEQADALEYALRLHRPRVMGELHDTGLKVLRNPRYAKRWTPWQQKAIDAADHFRLVRFDREGNSALVPVYAVWSKVPPKGDALDGGTYEAFHFRNIPWQTAFYAGLESGPVIVEGN